MGANTMMESPLESRQTKIVKRRQMIVWLAFAAVYLFWGGTYLGMRVAIETIPPFIMAGSRFLIAGLLLYIWARVKGAARPGRDQWRGAAVVGALLLLCGNGVVAWAEQGVPSGIASLLIGTVPIWMIVLGMFGKNSKKPTFGTLIGIILGFTGIAILVVNPGKMAFDRGVNPLGVLAIVIASLSWAGGSLYSRKATLPNSALLSTAMQMLAGGAFLMMFATVLGEWSRFHLAQISARSIVGFGYLVFFGSIVAFNAYIWLLKNAEPAWVSTYAYVNPIVAVFLGWAVAGEKLTGSSLIAAVVIIAAVVMITMNRRKESQ